MTNWFEPPRRVMGTALRLSVVVGAIAGGVSFVQMHQRYHEVLRDRARILVALECAQRRSDEELAVHKNAYGLIDISKLYCAPRTFLASMEEIRDPGAATQGDVRYGHYVHPESILGSAVGSAVLVILLGLFVVTARRITLWVLGH